MRSNTRSQAVIEMLRENPKGMTTQQIIRQLYPGKDWSRARADTWSVLKRLERNKVIQRGGTAPYRDCAGSIRWVTIWVLGVSE